MRLRYSAQKCVPSFQVHTSSQNHGHDVMDVLLDTVLCDVFGMISLSRMKFCMMAIYYGLINCSLPGVTVSRLPVQFLACSVLMYTICIVLSVMIFLYNDHNNKS